MSKGKLRLKRNHRKAGQEKLERSLVRAEFRNDTPKISHRGLFPEGVLHFPQGRALERELLYGLPHWHPTEHKDREVAQLLRGVLAHLDTLLAKNPWVPFPQKACSFTFGPNRAPLPLGALALLWKRWPMATGTCFECDGQVLATAFWGLLSRGKVLACCSTCGRAYTRLVGGLGALGGDIGPYLKGTEFYVATGIFAGAEAGPKRPLWEALKELGISDLPDEKWASQ